jgi:hypothetical protein
LSLFLGRACCCCEKEGKWAEQVAPQAKDDKKIGRIEGALKYMQEHYEEGEEPLY